MDRPADSGCCDNRRSRSAIVLCLQNSHDGQIIYSRPVVMTLTPFVAVIDRLLEKQMKTVSFVSLSAVTTFLVVWGLAILARNVTGVPKDFPPFTALPLLSRSDGRLSRCGRSIRDREMVLGTSGSYVLLRRDRFSRFVVCAPDPPQLYEVSSLCRCYTCRSDDVGTLSHHHRSFVCDRTHETRVELLMIVLGPAIKVF